MRTALAGERLCLDEAAHALLEEERIAGRAFDQQLLEWRQRRIVSEKCRQELLGALVRQRLDSHLFEVRRVTPRVPVLGAIVHQEQHARALQDLDQTVQQRLGLRVDPVEFLKNEEEWTGLALTNEEALHRFEHPVPAL